MTTFSNAVTNSYSRLTGLVLVDMMSILYDMGSFIKWEGFGLLVTGGWEISQREIKRRLTHMYRREGSDVHRNCPDKARDSEDFLVGRNKRKQSTAFYVICVKGLATR